VGVFDVCGCAVFVYGCVVCVGVCVWMGGDSVLMVVSSAVGWQYVV